MKKPIKVLIVEDSENDAALSINALQGGGYDPAYEIVETPEAMADALNRLEWDLVISEYSMPRFSGLDALKLLQDKDPDLSFILMTGQVGEDVAVEAMKAGAHDFILKGNPARLIPAVERELRDTRARRRNRQNEQALRESRERYRLIVETGSYAGAIGMHVDITERKRSEDELALRAQLLDSANDSIVLHDFEGRLHYVNEVACRFYGYTREEIMQKNVFELNTLESAKGQRLRINELRTKGCCVFEAVNSRKDGSRFPIEVNARVVDIGGKQFVLSVARDITERKQAEEALRKSEEKYRMIFNATGTAAVIIEEDTTISLINREFETLSGYAKGEIEGKKSWKEFIIQDYLDDMIGYHNLRRADPDSAPKQYETAFIARKGDVKQVIITVSMIPGTNQSIAFLLDISGIKKAEKATKQSEEKFRTLFEEALVGIGIARAGKTLMANRAYLDMFGYASVTELEGTPLLDQIAPQCRSQVEEIARGREQGKEAPRTYETVGLKKDGSQFPFYVETARIELPDGPATIGYFTDITDSKNAQELRDKYILLSTYNRDIILYVRRSDGRIIEANEAAVKEYGYSRVELLGMTIYDLRTEDERQLVDEQMKQADERGIAFETYHLRKDGSVFPVEVSSQGTTVNGDRILLSIIRNITLRRQQEEKLLIANEVFENTLTGIIVISRDGVVQRINPAFTGMTGYNEEDVIGQKIGILGYDAALSSAESYRGETWNKRKDGTSYLEGFVINASRDEEGNVLQYIKSFRDITEEEETKRERQLLLEQQERMQRLSSLSTLSAGIVHEIAQPLNAIKLLADGMLYLYSQGLFKLEDFIKSLKDIAGQAERINTLINQMRSFANAGRQNEETPCNLNKAVRSIINILGQRLSNHGIITKIEVDENLLEVVGTASGYEELVLNLLTNAMYALDSVDKREKEIVIRTFSQKNKAVIEIADNATGICDDIKDRIFEPLFTTKIIGEGMGLGLSIAQSIIERFNGSIDAQNNVNGGATFTVQLPAI